ncbi:MAG TPA: hypothetical protein VHF58_01770 [Solirubrobacterales bacterium]|nr:hypothetical protein [Solirubrobacterales bacterium]
MLGAGTIINPIIKIVTTVAILAAVGIFIVRPVLDTTEDAIDSAAEQSRQIQENVSQNISEAEINSLRTQLQARSSSLISTWPEAARELRDCARGAGRNAAELAQCQRLSSRITGMLSDHNIAAGYANTLTSQGDAAAAERIDDCMADADFQPGPMRRCKELSEKLLFG